MTYSEIYVVCAGYLVLLSLYAARIKKSQRIPLCIPGIIVFFSGSLRTFGVDRAIYVRDYYERSGLVADLGYQFLADLFINLGLPFEAFSLFLAIIAFISIVRLSRFFEVNFIYLFTFYFVFFFILRDLAHMRVAVSGGLIAMAIGSHWPRFMILSMLALSFHLSSVAAICGLIVARIITGIRQHVFAIWVVVAVALGLGFLIQDILAVLAKIDYRIQHYQIIDKPLYGNRVSDFTGLVFHFAVMILGFFSYAHRLVPRNEYFEQMLLMQLFGIVCFITFRDISIFAFRLSHLFFSFFPIIILMSFDMFRKRGFGRSVQLQGPILAIVFGLLFFREVSFRVLDTIGW